ncbi:MAG TPA: thermonuclease family protein [Pyrinomonadaceae bacterium]|nr:thermonuclease family protein [Pyrinomonadaceae bacterium]
MRIIFIILAVLLFCFSMNAQDGRPEFYPICGDPQNESMLATRLSGKVIKIVDGNTIIIKSGNKSRTIDLVAVDVGLNENKAKNFLSKEILKKNVFFLIYNDKNDNNRKVADVYYKDVYSASRSMITKGIAHYKKPDDYTFSNYKACVYQRLEEMAKKEKLGIWAK